MSENQIQIHEGEGEGEEVLRSARSREASISAGDSDHENNDSDSSSGLCEDLPGFFESWGFARSVFDVSFVFGSMYLTFLIYPGSGFVLHSFVQKIFSLALCVIHYYPRFLGEEGKRLKYECDQLIVGVFLMVK